MHCNVHSSSLAPPQCGQAGHSRCGLAATARPGERQLIRHYTVYTGRETGEPAANANESAAENKSNDDATKYDSAYESDGTTDETDEEDEAKTDKPHEDVRANQCLKCEKGS